MKTNLFHSFFIFLITKVFYTFFFLFIFHPSYQTRHWGDKEKIFKSPPRCQAYAPCLTALYQEINYSVDCVYHFNLRNDKQSICCLVLNFHPLWRILHKSKQLLTWLSKVKSKLVCLLRMVCSMLKYYTQMLTRILLQAQIKLSFRFTITLLKDFRYTNNVENEHSES